MAAERPSPTQQALGFAYDEGHSEQKITALAGVPLLAQAFRVGIAGECEAECVD
jgi:hypothetical protein